MGHDGDNFKVTTTPGRMILGSILPRNKNINYEMINKILTKKRLVILSTLFIDFVDKGDVLLQIILCK